MTVDPPIESDRLDGHRILVTGASRGVGRAVATDLAARGAQLVLVARDAHALALLRAGLDGDQHVQLALDVRDSDLWRAAQETIAPAGVLHGVVTAAAQLTPIGRLGSWDISTFRATVDVNLTGTLLAIAACLPALKETRGSVVTFSGGGATGPFPRYDAYAASKAAVVRLTENLAIDLAADGVRANAVAPGFITTEMHAETLAAGPERAGENYFQRTRQAVEAGAGDRLAPAVDLVAFLLSDASSGITGKLISAQWDPWSDPVFQRRLRTERDLATLRRIDDQHFRLTQTPE
jgi:NAD(P)-dependent dehydrogenase (short-subunit alcohol dehydrogenase family)